MISRRHFFDPSSAQSDARQRIANKGQFWRSVTKVSGQSVDTGTNGRKTKRRKGLVERPNWTCRKSVFERKSPAHGNRTERQKSHRKCPFGR
ncbi:hypothetical protein niasHT_022652 [Heterodera trifolii]|uniref:Uncharacterized protein n=1 Tax=Heterodera trifolii TaxID=157864 RepID=A0ABD2JRJ6_9BILA